ncbi:UNVERIFIED_ORG: hypothetical protein GGD59_006587 [Rhizobium esperanzae]
MTTTVDDRLPRTLSHYSTLTGFKGIIESGCLWASNASFLNDRAELIHALKASKKAISMISSKKALKVWAPMLKEVFEELSDGQKSNTYVSCFCGDDDNLSQWRGYGGSVQGVSITFDREALAKRLSSNNAALYKVTYARLSTASKLRDALAGELVDIAELDEIVGEADEEARYNDLLTRVSALLPKFKHLGFKDEREWRFVVQEKRPPKEHVLFRVSENKFVPYIKIGGGVAPLPITSVRVGPGTDQELTARSLNEFLMAHGYKTKVHISEVPFRQ